jgi:hypothetical protein
MSFAKERKNHYFKERFPKDGEDGSVGRRSEKLINNYKPGDKEIPWEFLDKSWLGKELVGSTLRTTDVLHSTVLRC